MGGQSRRRIFGAARGVEGQVCLRDLVMADARPIVIDLREPVRFAALKVEHDTVVWENGFDLAPEFLRANLRDPC